MFEAAVTAGDSLGVFNFEIQVLALGTLSHLQIQDGGSPRCPVQDASVIAASQASFLARLVPRGEVQSFPDGSPYKTEAHRWSGC